MEFEYKFNGTKNTESRIVIDVEDQWVNVLQELDHQEFNNDRAETRRHCSIETYDPDDHRLPSKVDVTDSVEKREDDSRLSKALSALSPSQQDLIYALFFQGVSVSDYAKRNGVTPGAITQRKKTALKKLKKLLKKT